MREGSRCKARLLEPEEVRGWEGEPAPHAASAAASEKGSYLRFIDCVSLNSLLESNKEEGEEVDGKVNLPPTPHHGALGIELP